MLLAAVTENVSTVSCGGGSSFRCINLDGSAGDCLNWGLVGDKSKDCESGNDEFLECASTTEGSVSVLTSSGARCFLASCTLPEGVQSSVVTAPTAGNAARSS